MSRTYSPLVEAILQNDLRLIKTLTGNPTLEITALHWASQLGCHEILEILLNAGWQSHINSFDDYFFTPLMWAATSGHMDCVQLLLDSGADVNAHDEPHIGNTVLREIVYSADINLINLLISAGADPTIPGWMNLTAIDKAKERLEDEPNESSNEVYQALMNALSN